MNLRFATFNVRTPLLTDLGDRWSKRKETVAAVIRDVLKADVIGLQECKLHQAQYLASELPEYDWVGVGRADGREGGEMVPIFHKRDRLKRLDACHFWLSETPEVPGSRSWGAAFPRLVTWARFEAAGRELCVFNAHFDHASATARLESARLLRSRVAEVWPLGCVVLGDFNATPGSEPHAALVADGPPCLRDAAGDDAGGTYHAFTGKPRGRIDWILVTPHFADLRYAVHRDRHDDRWPSDHFPVAIDAALGTPGKAGAS